MARIGRIYRYPIKGLSAEPVHAVELAAGEGLPLDRTSRSPDRTRRSIPNDRPGCPRAAS